MSKDNLPFHSVYLKYIQNPRKDIKYGQWVSIIGPTLNDVKIYDSFQLAADENDHIENWYCDQYRGTSPEPYLVSNSEKQSDENKDEIKFRLLYENYIKKHEKDLTPRSIIIFTDENKDPEVYKSIAEACPHIEGRSLKYRYTYYGSENEYIRINNLKNDMSLLKKK